MTNNAELGVRAPTTEEQFTLSIEMTPQGYLMIKHALGALPYNQVKALIDEIEEQMKTQIEAFNLQKDGSDSVEKATVTARSRALKAEPVDPVDPDSIY